MTDAEEIAILRDHVDILSEQNTKLNEKYEKQKEINRELVDENEKLKELARHEHKLYLEAKKRHGDSSVRRVSGKNHV